MKTRISLLFVLSMFILTPDILAGNIEINLMDNVTLEEKAITFSDVSTVTGDDVKLVNKINEIEIGNKDLKTTVPYWNIKIGHHLVQPPS